MSMIQVTIEFIGLSRILTHQKTLHLEIESTTTYRSIINLLAEKFPALSGQIITTDGQHLMDSNMISINGKHMIEEDAMESSPVDGDRIILMSILSGG